MSPIARSKAWRRRIRSHRAVTAAVATVLLLTSACGLSSETAGKKDTAKGPITIGMSLPLTGPVADRSKPGLEGYQYWADEINAKGGLLGRQVKLKVYDDKFEQTTAISDYNRLISQDKVDLLLGTFSSDLNLAVAPVAERYKYVYVEPSGGADEIFARKFTFLFFAQPATTQKLPNQFISVIEKMSASERPKSVAFIQADDPNTSQAAKIFEDRLKPLGVRAVYNKTYAPDTSNFDTIANAIKQAAPDLVISGALAGDGVSLIRSFQKVGFSPKMLYQENSPTDPAFPEAVGAKNTEAIFTPIAWSSKSAFPSNKAFVEGYTKQKGSAPSEDTADSYAAAQVLAAAVEGVGKLDQPAMADWLHKNTVDTVVGPMSWDATGKPQGELLLGQFQSGSIQVVAPSNAATVKDLVYAKPQWQ
jgi:branched-chain amino acid transport system substrate-binding protein